MSVNVSTGFVSAIHGPSSFASLFLYGVVEIRTGNQPVSADAPPTGSVIARITRDGGVWTAGAPDNGLEFVVADRYVIKPPDHIWRLVGSGTGVAGWFRLLPNSADNGALSTEAVRIDGRCGLVDVPADTQMYLVNTAITPSTDFTVPHWWYAIPPL